jgi:LmbE family N-acetylglucosaminyl deacetylase
MRNRELNIVPVIIFAFATILFGCAGEREDVTKYAPTESYPEDTILNHITNRKAMIVIAHDDDMCGMTGTLSKLNKDGWEIRVLSFPQALERNLAHIKACSNILDSVLFFDFSHEDFRYDVESTEKLYKAVPRATFSEIFNYELVEKDLIKKVTDFNPSVIFTLDNEIGGYGHPEHIFISQMVIDLAKTDSISPSYFFQNVWTDHMETTIMKRHSERMKSWGFEGDGWETAKKVYGVDGAPEPSIQIYITTEAQQKMNYLMSYNDKERKTMGFFIPAFEDYSAEEYFSIFDREFYRVIEIKN